MIYLYGLIEGAFDPIAAALDGAAGLQGPVQLASVTGGTLIYSTHDDQEILPKRRLLLTHARILEQVLQLGTVLPARFGLIAKDLAEVGSLLRTRDASIRSELSKVRGAIELGVRVSFNREAALAETLDAIPALRKERDTLRSKGAEGHFAMAEFGGKLADSLDRRRGIAQRALIAHLRPVARDDVIRGPDSDTEVLRAEFLIDAQAQHAFQSTLEAAATTLDFAPGVEPDIQIIGPVPMYNFVRLNLTFDPDQEAA